MSREGKRAPLCLYTPEEPVSGACRSTRAVVLGGPFVCQPWLVDTKTRSLGKIRNNPLLSGSLQQHVSSSLCSKQGRRRKHRFRAW